MRRDLFAPGHEADVFTFHAAHELLPAELSQAIVRESRLARLPGVRQRGHASGRWRYLLPYMPLYYRGLDLDSYDLVISSSHACADQCQTSTGRFARRLLLHADAIRMDAGDRRSAPDGRAGV